MVSRPAGAWSGAGVLCCCRAVFLSSRSGTSKIVSPSACKSKAIWQAFYRNKNKTMSKRNEKKLYHSNKTTKL